jgi:hypothetical protein
MIGLFSKIPALIAAASMALLLAASPTVLAEGNGVHKTIDARIRVTKIWDKGTHAAFTSLVKYNGKYYCSFREGYSHIFNEKGEADGKIRVICSRNGRKWASVLLYAIEGKDLRDPKLSITPDGRLMLNFGGSVYANKKLVSRASYVMFSNDGKTFGEAKKVNIDDSVRTSNDWLWRVTWHDGYGYGVAYSMQGEGNAWLSLLRTEDGVNYTLVRKIEYDGFPNETTVRFLPDGRMAMIVRRDAGDCYAMWGVSDAPYDKWKFRKIGFRVGGPDFIVLDDDEVILGTRTYFISGKCKTAIFLGNATGEFDERVVLPSSGDTSYPGLLAVGNELWVTYYASIGNKGKTAVYLARIPMELVEN